MNTFIIPIFSAIGAIFGAIIGSTFTYYYTRKQEEQKHKQLMRTQAYVDLIKGIAGSAIAQKDNNNQKYMENQALVTDARVRIAIYGSKSAVVHLAKIIRDGFVLDTPDRMTSFLNFCQMIRSETFSEEQYIDHLDIAQLLYSADL